MKIRFSRKRLKVAQKAKNRPRNTLDQSQRGQRVISYYTASQRQLDKFERNINSTSDNLSQRRSSHKRRQLWFSALVIIVLIIVLGYLCALGSKPNVSVNGPLYRSVGEYQKSITGIFGSDIRNRIKFLLRSNDLQKKMLQALPEAQSIIVSSTYLGHQPEVKIKTSQPLAIFSQPGSTDYIISNRGRLLLPVSKSKLSIKNLPLLQNQTGVIGKAGQQFMLASEAVAITNLSVQFKADNGGVISYALPTVPHELIVHEPGRGYYEKFLLSDNITQQYGALRATQKTLQEQNQTPSKYIDVRLIDKVYIK